MLVLLPSLGSPGLAWQAATPDDDGQYLQRMDTVPESLVPSGEKSQLRTQAAEADTQRKSQATPAVPPAATVMPPSREGLGGSPEAVQRQAQPTAMPTLGASLFQVDVDYAGWEKYVNANVQIAITGALNEHLELLPSTNTYVLTAFDVSTDGNWARAVILPKHTFEEGMENLTSSDIIELLIEKKGENVWRAHLFNTPEFLNVKPSVPDDFIDFSLNYEITSIEEYRFPWSYGRSWWKNGGWHSGYYGLPNNAIDFQSKSNDDVAVLAASKGLLNTICDRPDDPYQVWLKTANADGTTGYGHLDKNSINRSLLGQHISRGTHIGNLYNPGYTYNTPCGYGSTRHLHFVFPTRDISMYDLASNRYVPASEIGIDRNVSYTSNNQLDSGTCDATSIPSGYTKCADEGDRCNFSGTKQVYYGANSCFKVKSFSNGVDCNNNNFGDPIFGTPKACYVEPDSPPSCNPNADQIALFVDANYSGQCVVKGIGQYSNPGAIGLPNDSISSVKVGGNVKAILCGDDNYGGGCETFTSDDPDLGNNSIGNNQVSSVKVESRTAACNPNADQIALFVDANYSGQCVVKGIGQYSNPGAIGLPNDSISSLKVGGNVKAILCRDDNYSGTCETFTSDDSNLGSNSIGNDQVSSAKVERRLQPPNAPSNLSATTVSASQINLSWQQNSGNETGFKIYRNGSHLTSVGANVTSYQNTGLNCGTSYSYYVKAYNSAGESGASNTASATTQPCGAAITVDGVSVDWCLGGSAGVQEIAAVPLALPVKVAWMGAQSAAQPTGTFQIGRKFCMGIEATNHDNSSISTYWSWTTYNSSGVKIQQLSYDDWSWTMNPGWSGAGWGPTIPYDLSPGLYTFVGSIRYDSSVASKSTTFSIVGAYIDSADFDGDGRADPAVWRASESRFIFLRSKYKYDSKSVWLGQSGDIPVPADYDGDGRTDPAIWRPSESRFTFLRSRYNYDSKSVWLGRPGDVPVPADYDGDGKADPAIWRPSESKFIFRRSRYNYSPKTVWLGRSGDIPVPADYDGDGRTDPAIWRPSESRFTFLRSRYNYNSKSVWLGRPGDVPVPADYDGDDKADPAIWRPSESRFIFLRSKYKYDSKSVWLGRSGDIPVPADYDGDGRTDPAIWRPSESRFTFLRSRYNYSPKSVWLGHTTDIPVT